MRRLLPLVPLAALSACGAPSTEPFTPAACTAEWFKHLEEELGTGDGMGHGPDIGSGEWRSVIEFRLGIRDDPAVPDNQSPEWCDYISELMDERAATAE